ncbi:DUF5381 family protein [Paenibacillus sp. UMB4589-SE434]|uniref:DUF5381 family protein n=1 Tax=Paenibacillus sp. UMB4589-SE434 TaxID=3046314 RepID=UPI00254A3E91|nr:DUF5381 family protein [Paenibacillus sp. UMB4589-SE434]MDK8182240.1 DUF5381 family protein [Paenibacillus sp. UMB4589-SE434]
MVQIRYQKSNVGWKWLFAFAAVCGCVGLTYAALMMDLMLTRRFVAAVIALMGFSFFGKFLIVGIRALISSEQVLFSYKEEGLLAGDKVVLWGDIRQVRVEHTRIGILFQPIFPKFIFLLKNGQQVVWNTQYLLSHQEMRRWTEALQLEVKQNRSVHSNDEVRMQEQTSATS